ncbi:MAG: type II CAAX endopeptidase family protein [Cyanobacteria bacterium P01_F01_bin.53]
MIYPKRKRFEAWVQTQGPWRRIFIFLVLLAIAWLPFAGPIYWLGYTFNRSGTAEILALILLYSGFLVGLPRWGRRIHRWDRPFQHCGLIFQHQTGRDLAIALSIGVGGVFALFGLETLMGWATPTTPSPRLFQFIAEGLLMALAVGFAEEMMFRGWILAELEESYSSTAALVLNALFFAGTHFIKPWPEIVRTFPQFFGLVMLGIALVWARRVGTTGTRKTARSNQSSCRLGYSIGLHAGLIWGYYIVNVGGLSEYTGKAPEWVTGIDSNPLAGLLGIILLGLIGWQFSKRARAKTTQPKTVG